MVDFLKTATATALRGKKRKSAPWPVFAVGLRFHPTDVELVGHYLANKVRGEEEDDNDGFFIHEANVYESHPSELVSSYAPAVGTEEWYFYTHRERKYANGKRPNRKAGTGFWKATGSFPDVSSYDGQKLGNKRSLVFYEEGRNSSFISRRGTKTNWLMQEFVLLDHPDSWVCCKIYYHGKRPNTTTSSTPAEDHHDHQQQQQHLVPYNMGSLQSAELVPDQTNSAAAEFTSPESTASHVELLADTTELSATEFKVFREKSTELLADITPAAQGVLPIWGDIEGAGLLSTDEPSPPVLVVDPISTQPPPVLADACSSELLDQEAFSGATSVPVPLDTYAPDAMFLDSHLLDSAWY